MTEGVVASVAEDGHCRGGFGAGDQGVGEAVGDDDPVGADPEAAVSAMPADCSDPPHALAARNGDELVAVARRDVCDENRCPLIGVQGHEGLSLSVRGVSSVPSMAGGGDNALSVNGGEWMPRQVGEADGFGWFGVLTETPTGLLCAVCGWTGKHLGLHAYKSHGLTARQYREDHGLKFSQGLVVAATRERMARNGRERPNPALAQARDPVRASAIRVAQGSRISPAGEATRAGNIAQAAGERRRGQVVTCQGCEVQFCPLSSATRRRFCSRSCANRYNRRSRGGAGA